MITRLKKRVQRRLHDFLKRATISGTQASAKHSPLTKISQVQLYLYYQNLVKQGGPLPPLSTTGYRVFSQFDEDGMLFFLFAVLGAKTKTFVDIGSGDGINSNCANLAINFGWHGLFIDGNPENIARGSRIYESHLDTWLYPPKFICAVVTRENINELIRAAGFEGEVDLLSVDIDGNDYWVWEALECIRPRVVIIETHVEFGHKSIVVPYDANYTYPGVHPDYHGASPVAMVKLAHALGYRLVGANRFGFNTIYVQEDEGADLIPEVSIESILCHPRNKECFNRFEAIKDMPYVHV